MLNFELKYLVKMEMLKKVNSSDFFIVKSKEWVLRCDLCMRNIDLLNPGNLNHERAINVSPYEFVYECDRKDLLDQMFSLLEFFTIDLKRGIRVYSSSINHRFTIIETDKKCIEMDKELNGFKDLGHSLFNKNYYRNRTSAYAIEKEKKEYRDMLGELKNVVASITQNYKSVLVGN